MLKRLCFCLKIKNKEYLRIGDSNGYIKLIEKTDDKLVYYYYPEGDESKSPGIIIVDFVKDEITVTKLAEEDSERDIPPEELNELAEAINRMKRELGEIDFVELVTKPVHCIFYGDHAVREIVKHLREGKVPERGKQAWY